jgi:drug/metabolite transporter (DMT)-like permease
MLFAWILATASAPIYFIEVFCMIGGVLMPMLLSPFLLGESIGPVQWVGAVLLVFAAFFLSKRGGGRITLKTVLLATMAGLGNMGSTLTMKLFNIHSIGTVADFQLYTYVVCSVTLALVLLFFAIYEHYAIKKGSMKPDQKASPIRGKVLIFIGIAIVMMYAAQYLSTLSAKGVPAAVFYPLSYVITMPLVYLVDVLIYKERVTARGIIGIVIVTVSGILINLKLS